MNGPNTNVTPLIRKLGIKNNMKVSFINPPENIFQLMGNLPEGTIIHNIGKKSIVDYIHGFYSKEKDLHQDIYFLKEHLRKDGMIWISWPKGKSGKKTDLTREKVRELVLKEGLVDIKVCAINDTWSALKFVFRKKDRS
jgi:hypothetical protein